MADTSHKCCSAALCNNRSENRKDLIFHNFPLDVSLRKIWSIKVRRGDKKFASNTSLFCCSEHFTAEDYRKSLTGKRHDLVKNAVPSVFPWSTNCKESSERTLRAKAREDSAVRPFVVSSETKSTSRSSTAVDTCKNGKPKEEDSEDKPLAPERDLVAENFELRQKLCLCKFGLERFGSNDDDIFFYTGFESYRALIAFWNFVKPCSESLISWKNARAKVKGDHADPSVPFPFLQQQENERNRKREMEPIDQLWLFLTRVHLGLFERDLAHRFGVSVSTVSDVFVTWANYLYIMLGSLPVWPSKENVKEHLPDSFKGRYENVRGILDCTELKCELPRDYQKHSEMYSDYKSHDTFKGLVCISPSGWITFISQLYPGRISDKEIVERSNFCQLIEMGDQYLADKGFEIHDLIALRGGSLYIPPKRFSSTDQFTESQCFETMSIANVRIHVERAIKRIKAWHIFNQVLPLSTYGSINQIWTVCALLVNFQNPIISV